MKRSAIEDPDDLQSALIATSGNNDTFKMTNR